jgi:hypothetical protein
MPRTSLGKLTLGVVLVVLLVENQGPNTVRMLLIAGALGMAWGAGRLADVFADSLKHASVYWRRKETPGRVRPPTVD